MRVAALRVGGRRGDGRRDPRAGSASRAAGRSTSAPIDARCVERRRRGRAASSTARFDATESPPGPLRVDRSRGRRRWRRSTPTLRECAGASPPRTSARVAEAQLRPSPPSVELPAGSDGHRARGAGRRAPASTRPGGRAAYPSSVLMCCDPGPRRRRRADRPRLAARARTAASAPLVLAAAALCGVDEVYAMGGAQAIFALAYGTETVAAVDVIAGPGNAWVQEAKRPVVGLVGIDSLAGPSELMVVAGHDTDPEWVALDLCAQAEHGADGPLVARRGRGGACSTPSPRRPSEPRPSGRASATRRWRSSQVPDLSDAIDARQRLRPRAPGAAARRTRRCSPTRVDHRRLRLRRPLRRDRLRRLRRRLQPRPADRRRRALLGPARPGRLPPQDRDGRDVRPRRRRSSRPHVDALARAEGFPVHGESAMIRASDEHAQRDKRAQHRRDADPARRWTSTAGRRAPRPGVGFLDHMLDLLARHGRLGLEVEAERRPRDRRPPHGRGRRHRARPGARRGARRPRRDQSLRLRRWCRWTSRWPSARSTSPGRPLCVVRRRPAGDLDRRLRHRAGRGVLPRRRQQRQADPARLGPLRHQRPPHDRGRLQGLRPRAARGRLDRPRGDRRALDQGHA